MREDDLHGRQLLILLAFFTSSGGLLYLIGWLTRPSFLFENPLICAAIAGAACYPARFLVENRTWWKDLTKPRPVRPLGRRARRAADHGLGALTVLRMIVGVVLVLGSLAILPLGIWAVRDNQRLVEAGPVHQVEVVSVEADKWSDQDDRIVKVARPGDGHPVDLDGADQLDQPPVVGDKVEVVVDPSDPTIVILATADWSFHWYDALLGLVITAACLGVAFAVGFG
ncbi:hypothetical protein EV643_11123 [Kribbella sp. VKM Ac-2527]|uniref:Uncharacterized protein n=1 Tax=Kribbella caucasensis TaxID=2512215 RepID=A0A4R6KAQ9_9ACTN|nr:DUF3592 domain-containing protein [Kribbella sp. VKM Ac-2527]TDO46171.1 hypothetical protein EV643_11123 [Kribbella sp. VKM Ac-2527]